VAADRSEAQALFRNVIGLAAIATGGNLPYRRLCRQFGADLTCSEMIVADKLVRRSRSELTLLRHHPSETAFGIQLCGKEPAVMAEAACIAAQQGCHYIDLNFSCPIELIVRRGAGAALLKRPAKLGRIVEAVRAAVQLPLSVKIRTGWSEQRPNAVLVAGVAAAAGADAITVHGRARNQHFRRSADWGLIARVAESVQVPVIGNGDILTPWDRRCHLEGTAISSVLVARGALIKPWIFQELKTDLPICLSVAERWLVMRRYWEFATEHFGDDQLGQQRVKRFFFWHLKFWHRYRHHTEEDFHAAQPASLIQTRAGRCLLAGDEALLAQDDPAAYEGIWQRVLDRDYPAS
jgi:tRNA-dihydrouridine synthase 3